MTASADVREEVCEVVVIGAGMAGLMAAPMVLIEVLLMGSMYKNKAANMAIIAASVFALIVLFVMIRQQTAVADQQFLRSMIPHHAAAILMCEKAPIKDPEIQKLCRNIIASQQSEIDQMNGYIVQMGQKVGVKTLVSAGVVEIMRSIDAGRLKAEPSNIERALASAGA
jgi:ketopantoate reductase